MKTRKKNGFTLVELLVVMAILVTMMTMLIGILNPAALVGKANDSKRKSDLNKVRTAFEEFFNDKQRYPTSVELNSWNQQSNCGKSLDVIGKYLKAWPCDPKKTTYKIAVDNNWFKVVVNLENKADKDIPKGWYEDGTYPRSNFLKSEANYGVSSLNVLWYEGDVASTCNPETCFVDAWCNEAPASEGCDVSKGKQCYLLNYVTNSCNDIGCARQCCGVACELQ